MNITIPSLLDEVCVYGRFPKDDAPDIPSIDIQKQGIIRALQEMGIGNDGK